MCDRALWLRHGASLSAVSVVPVTIACPKFPLVVTDRSSAELEALFQDLASYLCPLLDVAQCILADPGALARGRDVVAAIHRDRGCRAIPCGLASGADHSRDNIGRGRRNYSRRRTNSNHRFYSQCRQRIRKVRLTTLRKLLRVRVS
jgi:hypothetical protein